MNISAPFIRRPVATTLLTIAVTLAGMLAFFNLPVSSLPQIDFATITVATALPGASPEVMASSVATPLERQFGHIAGVSQMTSSSTLGVCSVTLQFDLSRDVDGAARDVEAAINAARTYLPANLPANPQYRKINSALAPVMVLDLTSPTRSKAQLYDTASSVIQQKLSQVEGVGQVQVVGSSLPAVRIDANPQQLNSYGLGLQDLARVISQQNSNRPKGQISDDFTTADITANDQISKAADYAPLIVGNNGHGGVVRMRDVANVYDSVQTLRAAGFVNQQPAIILLVFRLPGANVIATVDRIKATLPSVRASIPAGDNLAVVTDLTTTIRASVNDVERTLVISVILVIAVVFAFLRSPRGTLIPGVAVGVSLIGTFGVMYLVGYSLDNLSLMALTISTGFVVDDAIVVMENITRLIELGVPPMEASLQGAQEVGFTVLSMSLSLIAVFVPILFMGGVVGRIFHEFAFVLTTSIAVSMLVSLTVTPMMCSRLLKPVGAEKHNRIYRAFEHGFELLLSGYRHTLTWALEHPVLIHRHLVCDISLERRPDWPCTQRVFPFAGHRQHSGRPAGSAGCLVSIHARFRSRGREGDAGGSGGAERPRFHRRWWRPWWRRHQQRFQFHHPQAAQGARHQRCCGGRSLASQAAKAYRRFDLPAGVAGSWGWRPPEQRRVPVPALCRHGRRPEHLGSARLQRDAARFRSSRT